jgi:hypothetical protein
MDQTKGLFTRTAFQFDTGQNHYICTGGNHLKSSSLVRGDGTMSYLASTRDCRACAQRPRCTTGTKRIVTRNMFEAEREQVRAMRGTEALACLARERKKVQMRSDIESLFVAGIVTDGMLSPARTAKATRHQKRHEEQASG